MIRVFFTAVVALVFASCLDSKENKVQRFLIQGNDKANKQSYGEAKRYYNEALKMDSCFVDAWNNLGTVYYKEKHFPEALDAYSNALLCDPKFRQALLNRSNTLYELGKYDQAMRDINQFASLGKDTLVTHLSRGLIYTRTNELGKAIRSFKQVLEFNARHVDALVNLGTVYYYRKQYDSAKLFLNNAIQIEPNEANAYNVYSLVELEHGNAGAALERINQALSLRGNDPYFLNNRGYIFVNLNELDKALIDIDKSISEDPYNAWAYRNKGIYYLKTNHPDAAMRVLTQAMKMDTTVTKLFYYVGEAYVALGEPKKGCAYFQKSKVNGDISENEIPRLCPSQNNIKR
jgi:tetratricopeptide (TPR) repeat protein